MKKHLFNKRLSTKLICLFFTFMLTLGVLFGQEAVFHGRDKSNSRTALSVVVYHPTFDMDYPPTLIRIGESEYQNDSIFTIRIPVEKPVSATFNVFAQGRNIHYQSAFISPNDSLAIVVDTADRERPLSFAGPSATHYNIYREYDLLVNGLYADSVVTFDDFQAHFAALDKGIAAALDFGVEWGTVSEAFLSIYQAEKQARYIGYLADFIRRKFDATQEAAAQSAFSATDWTGIAEETLLSSRAYTRGLTALPSFYRADTLPDGSKYALDIQFVNKHFEGKVREYLLADLTRHYSKNPTVVISAEAYEKHTMRALENISDSIYRDWARDNLAAFGKLNSFLPEEVLGDTVLNNEGMPISIADLLETYRGKDIVFDLWASWCVPCIQEFDWGQEQVNKWKEKGVAFVYLSIDIPKDYDAMHRIAARHQFAPHNYVLKNGRESVLSDYLNLAASGIPRYVLFDKQGKLRWMNLPRPSAGPSFDGAVQKHTQVTVVYN